MSRTVNIKGAALCCAAAIPLMQSARKGSIVLISSIVRERCHSSRSQQRYLGYAACLHIPSLQTGEIAFPSFVPYSATKAALRQVSCAVCSTQTLVLGVETTIRVLCGSCIQLSTHSAIPRSADGGCGSCRCMWNAVVSCVQYGC